jgi:hypothetical protein
MRKGQSSQNFHSESFDHRLRQGFVLFYKFEQVSTGAVLGHCPHVILGFHVFIKPDDIGVVQFFQHASLIQNFLFSGFVHTFDGDKL